MDLLKEILLRLVTAPETRLLAVKAILDGEKYSPQAMDSMATISEAMSYFKISRSTIWRRVKAAGLQESMYMGGLKHYDRNALFKAICARSGFEGCSSPDGIKASGLLQTP